MSDLAARLTELINAATDRPDRPHTAHENHGFYAFCAICSGKSEEIAAALAPGVQALLAEQAEEIAQAIESRLKVAKAAHYRAALTSAAAIARNGVA